MEDKEVSVLSFMSMRKTTKKSSPRKKTATTTTKPKQENRLKIESQQAHLTQDQQPQSTTSTPSISSENTQLNIVIPPGYTTLSELKAKGLLSKECADSLADECPKCHAPILVSSTMKQIICSNMDCETKLARRMELMLKDLGVAEFGESRCEEFILKNNIQKPYKIFELDTYQYPDKYSDQMKEKLYVELHKNKKFTLGTLVKSYHLYGLDADALKIFKGYDSLSTFYADLDQYGEDLIAEKLAIQTTGGKTYQIKEQLEVNREDLEKLVGLFEIESCQDELFTIAITNGVTAIDPETGKKFKNKDIYVNYLTGLGKGKVVRSEQLNQSCAYLIADEYNPDDDSTWTGKIKTAKRWEGKGIAIKVVTSEELIDIVRNL